MSDPGVRAESAGGEAKSLFWEVPETSSEPTGSKGAGDWQQCGHCHQLSPGCPAASPGTSWPCLHWEAHGHLGITSFLLPALRVVSWKSLCWPGERMCRPGHQGREKQAGARLWPPRVVSVVPSWCRLCRLPLPGLVLLRGRGAAGRVLCGRGSAALPWAECGQDGPVPCTLPEPHGSPCGCSRSCWPEAPGCRAGGPGRAPGPRAEARVVVHC